MSAASDSVGVVEVLVSAGISRSKAASLADSMSPEDARAGVAWVTTQSGARSKPGLLAHTLSAGPPYPWGARAPVPIAIALGPVTDVTPSELGAYLRWLGSPRDDDRTVRALGTRFGEGADTAGKPARSLAWARIAWTYWRSIGKCPVPGDERDVAEAHELIALAQ